MAVLFAVARRRSLVISAAVIAVLATQLSAFNPPTHVDVTEEVLKDITRTIDGHVLRFSSRAIKEIIRANTSQDEGVLRCGQGQFPFSDSINHFDSEDLARASAKLIDRVATARAKLVAQKPNGSEARKLLGQALHAVQDYYSHTNWVVTQGPVANSDLGQPQYGDPVRDGRDDQLDVFDAEPAVARLV